MPARNDNHATASPSRGRPADPRLEGAFVEAALQLVAEKGYAALTTAAVAKRAGASTASLYRRWPTKRSLVTHIARTVTLDVLGEIDTGTLRGDLRELLTRKQQLFDCVGPTLLALLAEARHDDELREILHQAVIVDINARSEAMLDRAVERGEIPEPDTSTAQALTVILVGGGLVHHALLPASPEPGTDATVEAELTLILTALAHRPGPSVPS
ncbi:TetR/AcrR family transcriptional regulator [Streptomyces boluensis]|uniref:TetR family transcriptional regulator n=1 Tax=Streptomyces boluensis TaxID=1775135 RepID=A0A964XIU8_9ACTN|nr:TetR/AcrR family transcriptional regulator [Streptomyces boluensis]NBE50425.1 TetR family transcriptional regulator [Streptomyces boluensis]